jgi:hypothetical protein
VTAIARSQENSFGSDIQASTKANHPFAAAQEKYNREGAKGAKKKCGGSSKTKEFEPGAGFNFDYLNSFAPFAASRLS